MAAEILTSWIHYLKPSTPTSPGGRLIFDSLVPLTIHGPSIFAKLWPEFKTLIPGYSDDVGKAKVLEMASLETSLKHAGLVKVEVFETKIFPSISTMTRPEGEILGYIKGESKDLLERPATMQVGGEVFDAFTAGAGMKQWRDKKIRQRWAEEWVKLGVPNEKGEMVVRNEGRLIMSIGFRA
ncbi:hypothetical protein NHQ30_005768 [Ciborinia camelliae]|nr:hypothetical protein NHQ30_005768 [Ciborinia camelliae]